jgi:hypothetical protein
MATACKHIVDNIVSALGLIPFRSSPCGAMLDLGQTVFVVSYLVQ